MQVPKEEAADRAAAESGALNGGKWSLASPGLVARLSDFFDSPLVSIRRSCRPSSSRNRSFAWKGLQEMAEVSS